MSVPLRVKLLLLVVVWLALNSAHGQPVTPIGAVGEGYVDAMAFTHDGKFLYSTDYLILEYDPLTGRFEKIHQVHESRTIAIAGFPHDSRVAIATEDGWIYVWDRDSDAILAASRPFTFFYIFNFLSGQGGPKLTINGSGDLVALVYWEYSQGGNGLILFDANTLTPIPPPPGDWRYYSNVPAVFSQDGLALYAQASDMDAWKIVKWDFLNDTVESVKDDLSSFHLTALTLESDGLRYGLGFHDKESCKWSPFGCGFLFSSTTIEVDWSSWLELPVAPTASLTTGRYSEWRCGSSCSPEYAGFLGAASVISPGGRYLIRDHQLTEITSGTVLSDGAPRRPLLNHDATIVAGTDGGRNYPILFMFTEEGQMFARIPTQFGSSHDAFTVNESARSLTAIQGVEAIRYDLDSGNILGAKQVPTSYYYTNGAITSTGGDFSVVYTEAGAIVGDGDGLTTQTVLLPNEPVSSACINPLNNRLMLVANELREYEVNVDDFARTTLTRRYDAVVGDRSVYEDAAYTPDGEFLLAAAGGVRKFSTADGALVGEYHLDLPCHALKVDPSGSIVVCGVLNKAERLLQIYRLDTMERVGGFSVPEQGFDFLGEGAAFLTTDGRLWQTDSGKYLGSIRPTSNRRIDWVGGSRTSDMVWLGDFESILGWRIPAERLVLYPDEIAIDQLLWRQHVVKSPDRNGDGVLDVADVLLASRSEPPSAGAADIVRAPSRERRADSESPSRSIEEKLLPPISRPHQ